MCTHAVHLFSHTGLSGRVRACFDDGDVAVLYRQTKNVGKRSSTDSMHPKITPALTIAMSSSRLGDCLNSRVNSSC